MPVGLLLHGLGARQGCRNTVEGLLVLAAEWCGEKQLPFLPHASRRLLKRSGKPKQDSFLGLETSMLEKPVPVQRGIQRTLQEMSFFRS